MQFIFGKNIDCEAFGRVGHLAGMFSLHPLRVFGKYR